MSLHLHLHTCITTSTHHGTTSVPKSTLVTAVNVSTKLTLFWGGILWGITQGITSHPEVNVNIWIILRRGFNPCVRELSLKTKRSSTSREQLKLLSKLEEILILYCIFSLDINLFTSYFSNFSHIVRPPKGEVSFSWNRIYIQKHKMSIKLSQK